MLRGGISLARREPGRANRESVDDKKGSEENWIMTPPPLPVSACLREVSIFRHPAIAVAKICAKPYPTPQSESAGTELSRVSPAGALTMAPGSYKSYRRSIRRDRRFLNAMFEHSSWWRRVSERMRF